MLQLPNGCWCSNLNVTPKNWQQIGVDLKRKWYIHYRFYDPTVLDEKGKVKAKLCIVKGMNEYSVLLERRAATKQLLSDEIERLKDGYNPIPVQERPLSELQQENVFDVTPDTPFIVALRKAYPRIQAEEGTLNDIRSVIKGVEQAATVLKINNYPIKMITRKYIKVILETCARINPRWTNNRHNKYRTYLIRLFVELLEMEAVEANPVRDIAKKAVQPFERKLPSADELEKIDNFLRENFYTYWRFVHVFSHSGSRITELMRLQVKDIDLVNQSVKYLVKKGKGSRIVYRPIKDCVLHLWNEILKGAGQDDYLFGRGLVPGTNKIRPDQIYKRWSRHIKSNAEEKLNIDVDCYSLKHLNTTQTADILEKQYSYEPADDVATMNGHTSTAMVVKIYDKNFEQRKMKRLQKVNNPWGSLATK